MKKLLVSLSATALNLLYRPFRKKKREDEAAFISRQAQTPSYDFQSIAEEFERRGWKATMHLKKVSGRALLSYPFHVLGEIKLLGRCKVVILDRYDPVVSLLNFDCEDAKTADASSCQNLCLPKKPVIMQLWHAFGAYKKFGFQSVGTIEGHSEEFTNTFFIHRNYSWVACSGSGAREAFSEAFSCPPERVIALDRPEYDELASLRSKHQSRTSGAGQAGVSNILMAPTLRKSSESHHPFKDLYEHRSEFESAVNASVTWSFHPLEAGLPAPGNVSDYLLDCDLLVTDYSSIVYEAYLLGIPTIFYIPDIEQYRSSPGLNADPLDACPEICARTQSELVDIVHEFMAHPTDYRFDAFERFAQSAFDIDGPRTGSAAERIVDFLIDQTNGID